MTTSIEKQGPLVPMTRDDVSLSVATDPVARSAVYQAALAQAGLGGYDQLGSREHEVGGPRWGRRYEYDEDEWAE